MPKKLSQQQLLQLSKSCKKSNSSSFLNITALNNLFEECEPDECIEGVIIGQEVREIKNSQYYPQAYIEADLEGREYKITFSTKYKELVEKALKEEGLKKLLIHRHAEVNSKSKEIEFKSNSYDVEFLDGSDNLRFKRVTASTPINPEGSSFDLRGFHVISD